MKGVVTIIFLVLLVASLLFLLSITLTITQRYPIHIFKIFRKVREELEITCEEWRDYEAYKEVRSPEQLADLIYSIYVGSCGYGIPNRIIFRYTGERIKNAYIIQKMVGDKYGVDLVPVRGNCQSRWGVGDYLFLNEDPLYPIELGPYSMWVERKLTGTSVILCNDPRIECNRKDDCVELCSEKGLYAKECLNRRCECGI